MTFIVPSLAEENHSSPSLSGLLTEKTELHHFLPVTDSPILSFSEKIKSVAPLRLLREVSPHYYLHFYWENRQQEEFILAYGVTEYFTVDSGERFKKSQDFLKNCLKRIIYKSDSATISSTPHLFYSFTFFESPGQSFPIATVFLPTFQIVRQKENYFLIINVLLEKQNNVKSLRQEFFNHLEKSQISKQPKFIAREKPSSLKLPNSVDFISAVKSALHSIAEQSFSKIVLAHALDISSKKNFNVIDSLEHLLEQHSDCHIFSFGNSQGKTFLGASPERLISIRNQKLITDALAGSAPRGKTLEEDEEFARQLLNNEKEKREHQAVSNFIKYSLQQLGLKPECSELKVRQLSNIQHLWTSIYAELPPEIHPLEILARLHPTPAVAGVPTNIAVEQIKEYENFDRGLYAAPIGWIDYEGNCEFIVGIRSALIENNHARLYAGAGIVAGSDPYKELAEIELKFQVLLKALGRISNV